MLFVLATGLTVMYTARLIYYRLRGDFNLGSLRSVRDEDQIIVNSISILGLGAILGGAFLSWLIFPEPSMICMRVLIKRLVIVIRIVGFLIGYIFNITRRIYRLISLKNYKFVIIAGSI